MPKEGPCARPREPGPAGEVRLEDPAHAPGIPGGRCSGRQVAEPEGSGKEGARTVLAGLLLGGLGFRVTL